MVRSTLLKDSNKTEVFEQGLNENKMGMLHDFVNTLGNNDVCLDRNTHFNGFNESPSICMVEALRPSSLGPRGTRGGQGDHSVGCVCKKMQEGPVLNARANADVT